MYVKPLFIFNSRIAKHGSFEDLILALAVRSSQRGSRPAFVFPAFGVPELRRSLERHANVHVVDGDWRKPSGLARIKKIVEAEKPQVLNCHFCDILGLIPFYLWARCKRIKIINHFHGEILPQTEVRGLRRHANGLRMLSLVVDKMIAVSRANADYLRYLHVRSPVDVIYNGIDLRRFPASPPAGAEGENGKPRTPYICYLGSLIPRKRIDFLLSSFVRARRQVPELSLVIIGGGEIERYRAMAQQLGIAESVRFTGLARSYPFGILRGAYLMASASLQESFGLVFAEALALAVPVVACRIGGIPEVVKDGEVGLLADPHDVDDFAGKLIQLLRNPELRQSFAARGPSWVAQNFSLDEKVDQILDALGVG